MAVHKEIRFEEAIEAHLLANGWIKANPADYSVALGLDPVQLFGFINATQAKEWSRLVERRGGDAAQARQKFLERVVAELHSRGMIDVLRRGVMDTGVQIQLAIFRPAHGLTAEIQRLYAQNRLTVTRQLHFSEANPDLSLDTVLSLNGLPICTAELKNHFTNQTVEHAMRQYRQDRDPRELIFSDRTIAHFAVDQDVVYMTTRLEGESTEFVPFNQGHAGGKGNPPNPLGYRTGYLWEETWQRDNWLELLSRFVQTVEVIDKKTKHRDRHMIHPRYHQWNAVRKLVSHVDANGVGHRYLIQHSAGSGKSNTIAWAAHRFATMHDANDQKRFDRVIVISDRVNLDQQLQDTVHQFEQVVGAVRKIEHSSDELAHALTEPGVQIIVTTLQKFPFVIDKVAGLGKGRYAILIDEAHSSQTGESAKALKAVLGAGSEEAALLQAEQDDAKEEAEADPDEEIIRAIAARGVQPNLTYVAFTATPKQRTLELFGTKNADGKLEAFDLYSMRQAIEEGFILDPLTNYVTYKTYWKVAKRIAEQDPIVDRARAAASIAKYVSLHPANFAQRAELIVEQVRRETLTKIGGRAKAMVVTRSRLHAVRMKQAIDRYISEKGYDVRALVAFSGTVETDGLKYTEAGMNGFGIKQLPAEFVSQEPDPRRPGQLREKFHILVVAEKYQTGYDEPLLHTMFVDKKLDGLRAVQTLSRLNRPAPGKVDTFVLDFANEPDDIQEAYKPYYDVTLTQPTDPNVLYNRNDDVMDAGVIDRADVDEFVRVLTKGGANAHPKLVGLTERARERFKALSKDDRDEFRSALQAYCRLYTFLGQIVPFADKDLEKLYLYGKFLLTRLEREAAGALDLGKDVVLTHLRTELKGTHDLSLQKGQVELPGFRGEGRGKEHEPTRSPLSEIIQLLNERFGTALTSTDELYFQQIIESMAADENVAELARVNTLENFRIGFDSSFEAKVIDRREANEAIFERLMDNQEFADVVKRALAQIVYERVRDQKPV
ncbi:MAG: type I restriction endonuclease subunit R [Chloroflexota bacterium]|nr:type I restriction endonuclease subunit R [Chloroflexota bacterium]